MSADVRNHFLEKAKLNPFTATGRTRRRLFGTQYEYEGPVRREKAHTIFNIEEWPRGLVWRYKKPEAMPR